MQFRNVSTEEHPIIYCALGNARTNTDVQELIVNNYNIDCVVAAPKDRYVHCMECVFCKIII